MRLGPWVLVGLLLLAAPLATSTPHSGEEAHTGNLSQQATGETTPPRPASDQVQPGTLPGLGALGATLLLVVAALLAGRSPPAP